MNHQSRIEKLEMQFRDNSYSLRILQIGSLNQLKDAEGLVVKILKGVSMEDL